MDLQGKSVVVLGAGVSGRSAARLARREGAEVIVADQGDPSVLDPVLDPLAAEGIHGLSGRAAADFGGEGADLLVLSPGIAPDAPWVRDLAGRSGATLMGEIEFAGNFWEKPIIAITGTNGKTTTTGLACHLLQATGSRCLPAGNYGLPFCEIVLDAGSHDCAVLEVSSFQLETIDTFHPRVSVWLNFAADHLDRHPDLASYHRAKAMIFRNQDENDWAIVNALNGPGPDVEVRARTVTFTAFGDDADFTLEGESIRFHEREVARLGDTRLIGRHNAENVMAALGILHARGVPCGQAAPHLGGFRPPAHRCERVAEEGGVLWVNDSKATNLHALVSALRSQTRPVVLVAGGKEKGLAYGELAAFWGSPVRALVAIGEIREALCREAGDAIPSFAAPDLASAVRRAGEWARPGDVVLFAPGTSSFDMFGGYEERGDRFRQLVKEQLSSTTP